ncbi:MAG: hypothetical protein AAGN35_11190 [Bacteroidota bacterium]
MTNQPTILVILAMITQTIILTKAPLQAQRFYSVEEALEEIEYQSDDVSAQALRGDKLLTELRQTSEDGDFRNQGKLLKKLHAHLQVIEDEAYAVERYLDDAVTLDSRIRVDRLRESASQIMTQAQFADMALRDVATALHEGEQPKAQQFLRETSLALAAIRMFARATGEEARELRRGR